MSYHETDKLKLLSTENLKKLSTFIFKDMQSLKKNVKKLYERLRPPSIAKFIYTLIALNDKVHILEKVTRICLRTI